MILRVILFLFISCSFAFSQTAIQRADDMFIRAASAPDVPGISVAVADESGVVWAKGFGLSNIEYDIPMTSSTKMRIGSVAKIITTAAMMKMVERGELYLDADIRAYIPYWPEEHPIITLRQLANHTAGVRHYVGDEFSSNVQYDTSRDALEIFKLSPLKFAPGVNYSYSTYGWTVISAAMEAASNKPFKQIVSDEVLIPLKLEETVFDDADVIIKDRQGSYDYIDGELKNSEAVNSSYKYAGGGFLATPSDMVKFAMAHTNFDYLKEETIAEMFERNPPSPHGIGWVVGFSRYINNYTGNPESRDEMLRMISEHPNAVMHSGGSTGALTMMILCPDHKHAVALTKNVGNGINANHFQLALRTLDIFY